jgi:hypothetical protein
MTTIREASQADSTIARNRSYDFRRTGAAVLEADAEAYAPGDDRYVRIAAGEHVTVTSIGNAGFRGIEATITTDDGRRIHGVSTGWLR